MKPIKNITKCGAICMDKDQIIRLPRGLPVLYIVAWPFDFLYTIYKKEFKRYGISYTEDDTKFYIKGFVSGDTHEKGLSIVALDNEKCCLLYYRDEKAEIIRKTARLGWYRRNEIMDAGIANCPY